MYEHKKYDSRWTNKPGDRRFAFKDCAFEEIHFPNRVQLLVLRLKASKICRKHEFRLMTLIEAIVWSDGKLSADHM